MRTIVVVAALALLVLAGLPAPSAQSDAHPVNACSAPYHVSHAKWDFCWQADDPRAQGIELNQVYYNGASVLWKLGVPFSMTQYDNDASGPFKDTLGSPGAGGHPGYGAGRLTIPADACPRFLSAGVRLDNNRLCVETRDGVEPAVAIWAKYNIYNYRFIQGYLLDSRGNIEPFVRMGGNLIDGTNVGENGHNHFHHLIWRADFDIAGPTPDLIEVFRKPVHEPSAIQPIHPNAGCALTGTGVSAGWTPVANEGTGLIDLCGVLKWRVRDATENNNVGRPRSFEFTSIGDTSVNGFSTMDLLLLQYKGDSTELGYEVPTNPSNGDAQLYPYFAPAEPITDPVVWLFQHIYHDTRDEDRASMTYHHSHIDLHPRNFHAQNIGEPSYP